VSLLSAQRVVVIDVETTGFDPASDVLLEVAVVALEGEDICESWATLVRPSRAIPLGATAVHGIDTVMVAEAPEPKRVAADLRRRCGTSMLAFHHARFDLAFLAPLLRDAGEPPLWNPVIDTLGLARGLPGFSGHSLPELAARLRLPRERAHRALGDARTTARLLVQLATRWEERRGVASLAELAALSQDALRLPARREAAGEDGGGGRDIPDRATLRLDLFGSPAEGGNAMQTTAAVPEIGQMAPEFRLKGPGGQFFTLTEYRGRKNVVLAFFPLAFSPVCSHQLPALEKQMSRFRNLDAEVLGISVDSHFANDAFAKHLGLSFPLLSDFEREASAAYGVLVADKGHSGRALFAVDRQGRIVHRDVSPAPGDPAQIPDHEKVLRALESLR